MNRSPMVAALADNLSHPEAMAVLDALAQFVDNERACIEEHGGPVERGQQERLAAAETVLGRMNIALSKSGEQLDGIRDAIWAWEREAQGRR